MIVGWQAQGRVLGVHATTAFGNFRAPKLLFWLPGSQPIPKLLALASLPI
eukprot:COSAG02_NODE_36592_length_452_cov_342.288952_2_plen_49_part_01